MRYFKQSWTATIGAICLAVVPTVLFSETQVGKSPPDWVIESDFILAEQTAIIEDAGAANRIVAGDILRTLSQEIPAAVCHLHNNVDVAEAEELLTTSLEKFEVLLLALMHGNEQLGIIGGEQRRKTMVELEELMASWRPIQAAATKILSDPTDAASAATVYASTDEMLDKTYHLLSELEAEYANPVELLQSDVMLLEVSGRMAAMTQRMAYEACRVWSGGGDDAMLADLTQTISIFETSMTALSIGMPEVGIEPAPTPEIAETLAAIASDWDVIRGYLDEVISTGDIPPQAREDLYHQLALKLYKVEELEVLYQNFAKRVY